jgi:hypothetical protein
MTARIDRVISLCIGCSAFDKLVATPMAQNGPGFDTGAMNHVLDKYMKNGSIVWTKYFEERGWKGDYTDIRSIGRKNYDTHFMIYRYALDLYPLYLMGWKLPEGITEEDLLEMMALGWTTNSKYEAQ